MKKLNSGHYVGTTPELRKLATAGHEVKTAFGDFTVQYSPRSVNDPKPWVSHGGDEGGYRYNARECYAEGEPSAGAVHCGCKKTWKDRAVMADHGHRLSYCDGSSTEPTTAEYAQASRIIQGYFRGNRRS